MRTAFSRVLLLPAGPPAAPLLPEELGRLGFGARRVDGCVVAPVLTRPFVFSGGCVLMTAANAVFSVLKPLLRD